MADRSATRLLPFFVHHALVLWAILVLVVGATKAQKVARLSLFGASDVGLAFAQDAAVLLFALALFLGVFAWRSKHRSTLASALEVGVHVLVPIFVVLAVFEHAFFLTTGSLLDGTYAAMRLHSIGQDLAIIRSELNAVTVAALVFPFGWSAGVYWWFRRRPAADAAVTSGPPPRLSAKGVGASAVGLGLLAFGLSFVPVTESAAPLQPHFLVGFIESAISKNSNLPRIGRPKRALPDGPTKLVGNGEGAAKNAILVILESTGARATSVYVPDVTENGEATTPALERLAKRGAVVERAYTSVPHTTKALVSLNCGLYPRMSPGTEEAKFGAIPTECLADLLRQQGFATGYFQSAEENYERRADLVREFGFEDFAGKESLDGTGFDEASYFGWEDDVLVAPTLAWVDKQRADDKRYFGALLTLTAHHPYAIPRGYEKKAFAKDRARNDYLNAVRYVDRTLEKLVAGLEERGALDDTLIIVAGDHGEGFGEHRRFQHDAVIYEEGIHIPMVLAGAGISPGTRIKGLRQNVDVAPTVIEALGYRPTGGAFDGKSLLSTGGHDAVYVSCHYQNYCMAKIEPRLKTIYHYKKGAPELFDLEADPLEKKNLLGKDPTRRPAVDKDIERMLEVKARNNRRYRERTKSRVERYVTKTPPDTSNVEHFRPMDIWIDDHTRIIGAAVTPEIEAGDQVEIITFYAVEKKPRGNWKTFLDVGGPQRMRGDHTPVEGAYPVRKWRAGDFIEDRFVLSTRPDTLVGRYYMFTGLKRRKGKAGIARKGSKSGKVVAKDGRIRLPDFRITKPKVDTSKFIFAQAPNILDDSGKVERIDATFGDASSPTIRVHAIGIDKDTIKGGLKTTLTYVFEVLAPVGEAQFFVDFDGPTDVKRLLHTPVSGTHPTKAWKVGTFIVDHHEIITHTRHRNGEYRVLLGLKKGADLLDVRAKSRDVDDNRLHVGSYTLAD